MALDLPQHGPPRMTGVRKEIGATAFRRQVTVPNTGRSPKSRGAATITLRQKIFAPGTGAGVTALTGTGLRVRNGALRDPFKKASRCGA
jgi:hypothetical protein